MTRGDSLISQEPKGNRPNSLSDLVMGLDPPVVLLPLRGKPSCPMADVRDDYGTEA